MTENKIEKTLPTVHCLANMDDVIERLIENKELTLGPVAQWSTGEKIYCLGKWQSITGYWVNRAIRWNCPEKGKTGMFAKGLACYGRPINWDNVNTLPWAK